MGNEHAVGLDMYAHKHVTIVSVIWVLLFIRLLLYFLACAEIYKEVSLTNIDWFNIGFVINAEC